MPARMETRLIPRKVGSAEATECVSTVTMRKRRKFPTSGMCKDWGAEPTHYCCQPSVGPAWEQVCLHLQRFKGISHCTEPLGRSTPSLAAWGAVAKVGPGEHQGFGPAGQSRRHSTIAGTLHPADPADGTQPCRQSPTLLVPCSVGTTGWTCLSCHQPQPNPLPGAVCEEEDAARDPVPHPSVWHHARCCAKRERLLGAYSMVSHVPVPRAQAQPHPTGLTLGSAHAPTSPVYVSICPSVHSRSRFLSQAITHPSPGCWKTFPHEAAPRPGFQGPGTSPESAFEV